jgi:uncharacterized protein (DUF305 family)
VSVEFLQRSAMIGCCDGWAHSAFSGRFLDDDDAYCEAKDFDQRFLESMISHHKGAVLMAETIKATATHPELRTFAEKSPIKLLKLPRWKAG